jgi:hypothetical protein
MIFLPSPFSLTLLTDNVLQTLYSWLVPDHDQLTGTSPDLFSATLMPWPFFHELVPLFLFPWPCCPDLVALTDLGTLTYLALPNLVIFPDLVALTLYPGLFFLALFPWLYYLDSVPQTWLPWPRSLNLVPLPLFPDYASVTLVPWSWMFPRPCSSNFVPLTFLSFSCSPSHVQLVMSPWPCSPDLECSPVHIPLFLNVPLTSRP